MIVGLLVSSRVLLVAVIAAPVAMALFMRTYVGKAFGAEKRDKKQRIVFKIQRLLMKIYFRRVFDDRSFR